MKRARVFDTGRGNLILSALAHDIQLSFEGVLVGKCAASYKNLLDVRLRAARHAADGIGETRRIAPAEYD